jgi:mannose-6-phosphate isomerase-like protein (cupin superfamily)
VPAVPEPSAVPFEGKRANISRQGAISLVPAPPGPPQRIDGYTIGAVPNLHGASPHAGEVHPDGDEFLYCVSGSIELILDDGDEHAVGAQTRVALHAGDAYVVPQGVWHVLESKEPSYLVHVTPGPHGGHRPRPASDP